MKNARETTQLATATLLAVAAGDRAAEELLIQLLSPGVRLLASRRLGIGDLTAVVDDVVTQALHSIRSGVVREPAELLQYVRSVIVRHCAAIMSHNAVTRQTLPESAAKTDAFVGRPAHDDLRASGDESAAVWLATLSDRDREALRRFYVRKQSVEEICASTNLSPDEFRSIKWRARVEFAGSQRPRSKPARSIQKAQQDHTKLA